MSDHNGSLIHQVMTPQQVADALALPKSTIYQLARDGRLPYVRFGRTLRFLEPDIANWIAEQREPGRVR